MLYRGLQATALYIVLFVILTCSFVEQSYASSYMHTVRFEDKQCKILDRFIEGREIIDTYLVAYNENEQYYYCNDEFTVALLVPAGKIITYCASHDCQLLMISHKNDTFQTILDSPSLNTIYHLSKLTGTLGSVRRSWCVNTSSSARLFSWNGRKFELVFSANNLTCGGN